MASSVRDIVMFTWEHAARKHGLNEQYAEQELNKMTRLEFLETLSEAIESRLLKRELQP